MNKRTRYIVQAAVIAAHYAVMTHLQKLILPGSATWMTQMRHSMKRSLHVAKPVVTRRVPTAPIMCSGGVYPTGSCWRPR